MSEYQYVHFLAIDRTLNEKEVAFMQRQSSRAEITPREFANEYNFGDFRGNAMEMLRRGYDIHLHYANFGIRKLMFRLPAGLPCDRKMFKAFCPDYGLEWHADKRGPAGILELNPEGDAGSYEEDVFDVDSLLHEIAPLRAMLIEGDLRPFYVAWLACRDKDEAVEPPVPAGLNELTPPFKALAKFYEIGRDLINAAAKCSPPLPKSRDARADLVQWVAAMPEKKLRELTARLLSSEAEAVRAQTLIQLRTETPSCVWPTAEPTRSYGELVELASGVQTKREKTEQQKAAASRQKHLKEIALNPDSAIRRAEELVKQRSTNSYRQAAQELADLREALGPKVGPARASATAARLRRANPKLRVLASELKKHGLLE